MPAVLYPSELPGPQRADIQSVERRRMTPADVPYEANARQTDMLAIQQIVFPPFTEDQAEAFNHWWSDILDNGGNWFAAKWALPDGWAYAVRRFLETPKWEFLGRGRWRVSASMELRGRGELPVLPLIDADIYLKFNETDATIWRDYSRNRRALTLHPNSGSINGITGSPAVSMYGRGGEFNQFAGGQRQEPYYGDHSWIETAGDIAFGSSDFIIDFYCLRRSTTGQYGWCVFDNYGYAGFSSGFYVWFIPLASDPSNEELVFSGSYRDNGEGITNARETQVENTEDDIGILTRYTFSRYGQRLSCFRDGVRTKTSIVFYPNDVMTAPTRGFGRVGCSHQYEAGAFAPGNPASPQLIDGFDGVLDDFYIAHGTGCGIDVSFTPPGIPWSQLETGQTPRQFLGLDP